LKVLQLGRFYPPHIGGIESVIYDLTEGLNSNGIRCDVLCSNKTNQTVIEDTEGGYRIFRTAALTHVLSTSISIEQIFLLRKIASEYDVIHIHHPDPMATLALYFSNFKKKVIIHWHSDIVRQKISFLLYSFLQRWLMKRASRIIATSENYASASTHLRKFHEKLEVIPIGTNVTHPSNDIFVEELRRRYQGFKIVFALGRLVYYKGYEFLIEALPYLDNNTKVLIGGEGPLRERLLQKVRASKSEAKIELLGVIPEEKLSSYYEFCDVFCLPSIERSEAFGVVLLEAMYYGKPIVTTNIPGSGVNWVNQHHVTGVNVEPKNPKALAKGIQYILSDSDRYQAFSQASRERYQAHFTRDVMIRQVIKLTKGLFL
jgi:glycosyltransferase involved in cell wall biosynthesis